MGWWVSDLWGQNPAMLISWVVWVIGSITLHELAHLGVTIEGKPTAKQSTGAAKEPVEAA